MSNISRHTTLILIAFIIFLLAIDIFVVVKFFTNDELNKDTLYISPLSELAEDFYPEDTHRDDTKSTNEIKVEEKVASMDEDNPLLHETTSRSTT